MRIHSVDKSAIYFTTFGSRKAQGFGAGERRVGVVRNHRRPQLSCNTRWMSKRLVYSNSAKGLFECDKFLNIHWSLLCFLFVNCKYICVNNGM